MTKFSSKEFIFPNYCSRLVTFMRSSFSFFLCEGWYDASCGVDCVGYGMSTIGATNCVGYIFGAKYDFGWRFCGFCENYCVFCCLSCRYLKLG